MVITIEKIFRDVVAQFPGRVDPFDYTQVVRYINHCYVDIRDQYIRNNQAEEFTENESLDTFASSQIPYLQTASLSKQILQSFPLDRVILHCIVRNLTELTSQISSFDKGDKVWKGQHRYRAVSDVSAVNSFAKTFEAQKVRSYYSGNGLKYKEGDVVFENGEAFQALNDVTATSTDDLSTQTSDWEQVYWVREGLGYVDPEVVDFRHIDRKKAVLDMGSEIVSVVKDTAYVSNNVNNLYIEYIPEHTDKEAFSDELQLPDSAFSYLKDKVVQKMMQGLGQPVVQEEQEPESNRQRNES